MRKGLNWNEVTDGRYIITVGEEAGYPGMQLTVTIKGNTVIYSDGSRGSINDICHDGCSIRRENQNA